MANPEFRITPEQFQTSETLDVARNWFHLPVFTGLSDEEIRSMNQRWKIKNFPDLERFLDAGVLLELAQKGQVARAVNLATAKISEIEERFNEDEARAGKFVYYRVRAQIQDYHAEYGTLSTRPRGDLPRSYWHLAAAFDFMRADLQYGVSECFGAAGMGKLQKLAFLKAKGERFVTLLGIADFGAPQILELEQGILDYINQ